MSYEPIKIPGKTFLANPAYSKLKKFSLLPTFGALLLVSKYELVSPEQILTLI